MSLLYSDETGYYCRCGGRLRDEVVEPERRYRLVVPEELRATGAKLRRRMERQTGDGACVEIAEDSRGERLLTLIVGEQQVLQVTRR